MTSNLNSSKDNSQNIVQKPNLPFNNPFSSTKSNLDNATPLYPFNQTNNTNTGININNSNDNTQLNNVKSNNLINPAGNLNTSNNNTINSLNLNNAPNNNLLQGGNFLNQKMNNSPFISTGNIQSSNSNKKYKYSILNKAAQTTIKYKFEKKYYILSELKLYC